MCDKHVLICTKHWLYITVQPCMKQPCLPATIHTWYTLHARKHCEVYRLIYFSCRVHEVAAAPSKSFPGFKLGKNVDIKSPGAEYCRNTWNFYSLATTSLHFACAPANRDKTCRIVNVWRRRNYVCYANNNSWDDFLTLSGPISAHADNTVSWS